MKLLACAALLVASTVSMAQTTRKESWTVHRKNGTTYTAHRHTASTYSVGTTLKPARTKATSPFSVLKPYKFPAPKKPKKFKF